MTPRALVALLCAIGAGVMLAANAGPASAACKPTFKEREAITAALPAWLRRYPVGCVALDITVSKNGKYATVDPVFLNATHEPCTHFASNGIWILKKLKTWRVIFNGSEAPPCSLGVPRDLGGCR